MLLRHDYLIFDIGCWPDDPGINVMSQVRRSGQERRVHAGHGGSTATILLILLSGSADTFNVMYFQYFQYRHLLIPRIGPTRLELLRGRTREHSP